MDILVMKIGKNPDSEDSSVVRFRLSSEDAIQELSGKQVTEKMKSCISLIQKCEDRENLGCAGCPKEHCDKDAYRNDLEEEVLKAVGATTVV